MQDGLIFFLEIDPKKEAQRLKDDLDRRLFNEVFRETIRDEIKK